MRARGERGGGSRAGSCSSDDDLLVILADDVPGVLAHRARARSVQARRDDERDALPTAATEIRMTTLHATRGANFWSLRPVTRMDLAVGAYDDISSAHVPGFTDALVGAMPGLVEHRCSIGERGGFIVRLRRGTYAPHIIEHVALELQTMIGPRRRLRTHARRRRRGRVHARVRAHARAGRAARGRAGARDGAAGVRRHARRRSTPRRGAEGARRTPDAPPLHHARAVRHHRRRRPRRDAQRLLRERLGDDER